MAAQKFKNLLQLLLKIIITSACLWYVIHKIDWSQSWQTFKRSNIFWLMISVLLIIASKFVAAFRLNIYFKNINVNLNTKANLRLYWLSMFYNIFLPGGIGGDAYKVIVLNKKYQHPAKFLAAAVLLDRASGVVGICLLSVVYYCFVFGSANYSWLLILSVIPAMAFYYFIVKKFFPSFIAGFWPIFWMGLIVQALQVVCVYSLMRALHLFGHDSQYVLIFLISSLIAVLPFTIGGLGAREVVFLWGSKQFLLNQDQSVCISLLFYLISVGISLPGMFWVYRDALEEKS